MRGVLLLVLALAGARVLRAEPRQAHACVGERSSITYTVVHRFKTVHGVSQAAACTVWVDQDTSRFRIRVEAPVQSFHSGNGLRDSHAMRALRADRFPTVVFASDFARPLDGRLGPYRVKGKLVFNGVARPLELQVTPELRERIRVSGTFPFRLTDFEVKRPSLMGLPVEDGARIDFDLDFGAAGGGPRVRKEPGKRAPAGPSATAR